MLPALNSRFNRM